LPCVRGATTDAAEAGVHLSVWYLKNFNNAAAADGWLSAHSS
jgi:hypothetical protein